MSGHPYTDDEVKRIRRHFVRCIRINSPLPELPEADRCSPFDDITIHGVDYAIMLLCNELWDRMTALCDVPRIRRRDLIRFGLAPVEATDLFQRIKGSRAPISPHDGLSADELSDFLLKVMTRKNLACLMSLLYAPGQRRERLREARRSSSSTSATNGSAAPAVRRVPLAIATPSTEHHGTTPPPPTEESRPSDRGIGAVLLERVHALYRAVCHVVCTHRP